MQVQGMGEYGGPFVWEAGPAFFATRGRIGFGRDLRAAPARGEVYQEMIVDVIDIWISGRPACLLPPLDNTIANQQTVIACGCTLPKLFHVPRNPKVVNFCVRRTRSQAGVEGTPVCPKASGLEEVKDFKQANRTFR